MAVEEKDLEKITEHLYRWRDPLKIETHPFLFVYSDKEFKTTDNSYYSKDNFYPANFIKNEVLTDNFNLSKEEMELVKLTRDLMSELKGKPNESDRLMKEYTDSMNKILARISAREDQKASANEQQPATTEAREKRVSVVSPEEVGKFFGVPPTIAPMLFTVFRDNETGIERPYINLVGMLYLDAKKGYQKIDVETEQIGPDDWEAKAYIYPKVSVQMIEAFIKLSPEYQKKLFPVLFGPTTETGRANKMNVRNTKMYPFLKEMAKARAVNRASRLYCGYGGTTYEELPEGEVNPADVAKI